MVAIALAQTRANSDSLRGFKPPCRAGELGQARAALGRAEQDLLDLPAGNGACSGTEAGQAVSDLTSARAALARSQWVAEHSPRWRERRTAAKESAAAAARLADAEGRWQDYVAPELARLEGAIYEARQDVECLAASQEREAARWGHLAERVHSARRAADRFAIGLAGYRDELDGEKGDAPRQDWRHTRPAPSVAPVYRQPPVGRDVGPDL